MDAELRKSLAARFGELRGRYRELQEAADAGTADWRWSRGLSEWGDVRPLAPERNGRRLGRLTRKRAEGRFADQDQIGLDARGRPVLVRQHNGLGELTYETFLFHDAGRSESIHFQSPRTGSGYAWPEELVNVSWLFLDEQARPAAWYRTFANGGFEWETYDYDEAGVLVRIDNQVDLPPEVGDGHVQRRLHLTPRYGDDRRLTALDEEVDDPMGWRRGVWRLPSDRKKLTGWKRAMHEGLLRQIPAAVAIAADGEPVAAVGLLYDPEVVLPPALGVLTVDERDELLASAGDSEFPLYLWNPAEWSRFDTPELSLDKDPGLLGMMEELALEWQLNGVHEPGRRALVALTRDLNDLAWSPPVADDFVVFASDLEMTETVKNVNAALPSDRLREFRRRRWLLS